MTSAMKIDSSAKNSSDKIYNLAAGDPNLPLQDSIVMSYNTLDIQSAHNYCSAQGELKLRKLLNDEAPENVLISNGAKQLIYMALKTITNPFDKVIIIGPCWSSYIKICELLNLNYKLIIGKEENNYIPDISQIYDEMDYSVAAILINNPNNPTGVIYDKKFLDNLCHMSRCNDCWIISDEIYSDLIYTNEKFYSLKNHSNVIYINGLSKSYSLTGWRIGYAIADIKIIEAMTALQSQISGPPNTLIQRIIENCFAKLYTTISDYSDRINLIADINEIFKFHKPHAGFYFYIPIDKNWNSSFELCEYFMNEYNIALTPGDNYGVINTVRLSVANINIDDLKNILYHLDKIVDKSK